MSSKAFLILIASVTLQSPSWRITLFWFYTNIKLNSYIYITKYSSDTHPFINIYRNSEYFTDYDLQCESHYIYLSTVPESKSNLSVFILWIWHHKNIFWPQVVMVRSMRSPVQWHWYSMCSVDPGTWNIFTYIWSIDVINEVYFGAIT